MITAAILTEPWTLIGFILILALASYRVSRIFIQDEIFSKARNAIWRRYPPESSLLGYYLTCYSCLGLWVSALFVALFIFIPVVTIAISVVFSISAIVVIIDDFLKR